MTPSEILYLASKSPRRRELLTQIGVAFSIIDVDVPEERAPDETPLDYVSRLAADKARAGSLLKPDAPVLGADTIVVLDSTVLEKPANKTQAVNMLTSLSGQTHQVMTAVSICRGTEQKTLCSRTDVRFRTVSSAEAERYWNSGEPQDKAGGYGIQGFGGVFVEEIRGSYSAVVGLPLFETSQLLQLFRLPVWNASEK